MLIQPKVPGSKTSEPVETRGNARARNSSAKDRRASEAYRNGSEAGEKKRQSVREFMLSVAVLIVFLAVVYLLKLKHTPWSDFLDTADGFIGLNMRQTSWSMADRLGFILVMVATVAIEIVWAIGAIWLDKHLFRGVFFFPSGQTLLVHRRRNYGRGGAPSDFGTTVALTVYPLIVSWTFAAVYRTSHVRTWCYIFYAFSVSSSLILSLQPKFTCCDVSLLLPRLPPYSSRHYIKKM